MTGKFGLLWIGLLCATSVLVEPSVALSQKLPGQVLTPKATPTARARQTENWVPPDVDRFVPTVASNIACPVRDVLTKAGQRVQELVENVDRFTATEVLSHQSVDRSGHMGRPNTLKFDYLVSISRAGDGFFQVEELRNRSRSLDAFPNHLATNGTASLIMIFHPRYIENFNVACEGLGEWKGQPAWQVRFEQRADQPNRISSFVVDGKVYQANFRGRAWILADSFQIGRIDTDQKEQIPEIRLRRSHMSIEYRPVAFPQNNLQLWLPSSAELYMDLKGKRFYRKHSYTDFKLFSVDTQYEVAAPQEQPEGAEPAR